MKKQYPKRQMEELVKTINQSCNDNPEMAKSLIGLSIVQKAKKIQQLLKSKL